ncbi:MAG: DUF4981 domain-containing protein, partial [Erysipelotrichaceae bacterium]|nr:DUF4981 domain-containing protein [Erysipelotrichaceae bacterium]
MKAENYSMDWLDQPGVYQANRLESVSSFQYIIPDRKTSQSLNGDWLVYCSNTVSGRFAGFYHEDAQTSFFQTVHVPGHLQLQGYGKVQYTGKNFPWESREILRYGDVPKRENLTACYVKNFDLDPKLASGFVKLFFHGVDSAFYVWLNGQFVGYSEDSASPAAFDVTDLLRTRNNRLCVQVHQYCSGSWLENQDAMRFAGIYGDVTLQGYPKNRIEDLKITTDIGDDLQKARILLEMKSSSQDCSYLVRFKDREDNLLLGFETKHTLVAMDVAGIHLWSAEEPYLYTLEIDVLNSDMETVQSIVQKVGLRKIRMEDGIMKINGKRIVFHGINLNEFSRQTGRVISREEMIRYIRFLKQNNINAVRTSQLPLYEEWYGLCDEYGLYVMDEVNLCTNDSRHNPKGMKVDEFFPGGRFAWKAPVLDRAASLYHRHRNHPCVLIWSLGKDSSVGNVILEEAGYLRQQDPGRLLHYEGCWNHLTYHSCSDFLSRKNLTPEECEEILELKPGRPLILCEYSSLLGNAAAGLDKFARLEKYDLYQGGFLSGLYQQVLMDSADGKDRCGADFGVFPNGGHDCAKGLLFADGKPTPAVQAVKYHFQDFAITPGKYGVKIENNSLFTPLSDYEIRYFLHQEGKLIQQGVLEAEVLPGQQKKLFIDWDKCSKESVKTVSLHLKKDTGWAKAGHEVAFGQSVQGTWSSPEARKSDMEIVETPGCVYFEDQGFSACFTSNGLESVKYDSHEMLAGVPRPVFARAFTDNDRLSGFDLQ